MKPSELGQAARAADELEKRLTKPRQLTHAEMLIAQIDGFSQAVQADLEAHQVVREWLQTDPNAEKVVKALFALVHSTVGRG